MGKHKGGAQGFANKLFHIAHQRLNAKRFSSSPPPDGRIYHYTTAAGLQGIVESNCLHASAAYFLNDLSELEYGRRILSAALDQWQSDHPETKELPSTELLEDLRSKLISEEGHEALVESVYLACFCQNDNVLSQWRAYGRRGGYSIGFPVLHGSIDNLAPESPSYTALLTRVEYQKEKQLGTCREILESILPIVNDPALSSVAQTENVLTNRGPTHVYDFLLNFTQEMLADEILGFKDDAFEEEKEWRLIVRPRTFTVHDRDDHGKTPTKIYFRSQRGFAVPFLKLMPQGGKLPIARIRSGPSIDRARARASVQLLLKEHAFPQVEFDGSEITVVLG